MDSGMQISKQESSWWVVTNVLFAEAYSLLFFVVSDWKVIGWSIGRVLHFYSTFTLRKPFIHIVYRKSLICFPLFVVDDIKLYQSHDCFTLNETETTTSESDSKDQACVRQYIFFFLYFSSRWSLQQCTLCHTAISSEAAGVPAPMSFFLTIPTSLSYSRTIRAWSTVKKNPASQAVKWSLGRLKVHSVFLSFVMIALDSGLFCNFWVLLVWRKIWCLQSEIASTQISAATHDYSKSKFYVLNRERSFRNFCL